MDKYENIKKILLIKDNENDIHLNNYVDLTLESIRTLNDIEINPNTKPLEYLNYGQEIKLRSEDDTYSNTKNLKLNEDNFFVVGK